MPRAAWELTREMFLSETEADALVQHLRKATAAAEDGAWPTAVLDQLLVEGLLHSGLRNSEFCQLELGDTPAVHAEPRLEVHSGREPRTVSIPSALTELVETYAAEVRPAFLPADVDPRDPHQPLVFHERGRPFERTGLYRRVVRILTSAGLGERASVQLLRHTYGYLAYLRTGGNLLFVQRQLGHAHPMVTMVYAQFVEEPYDQLAEAVGELRKEKKQKKSKHSKRSKRRKGPR